MRHIAHTYAAAALLAIAGWGCSGPIYDDEGDCDATYRLAFRYDRNLKWADAFANEVHAVRVYAYDRQSGALVWAGGDAGAALAADGYTLTLPLAPGDYRLVAWCDGPRQVDAFAVSGERTLADMRCTMARDHDPGGAAYSQARLTPLYHGAIDVVLPDASDTGGDFLYTMPLTKDTNHVRIMLQHLSGEDVDANDFDFAITDANGLMGSDNLLLPDEAVEYRPWGLTSAVAGVDTTPNSAPAARAVTDVKLAIADFTLARLMADRQDQVMLTITRHEDGGLLARIPVIHYALLAREYYEQEYGHALTPQELLDREDEYVLTFFLDASSSWLSTVIMVHSWRIVIQDADLQ